MAGARHASIRLYPALVLMGLMLRLLPTGGPVFAATRHVPAEFATIQEAIDQSAEGDTVLLSPGIYQGVGNRDIEFRGRDVVLTSIAGAEETIIDCEQAGRGFYLHEHETPAARIEGVTVQNGIAPSVGSNCGGGILCAPSSPTIARCRIISNRGYLGGGICLPVFHGVVEHCVISGNLASGIGGGGLNFTYGSGEIRDCVITGNWGNEGGGVRFDGVVTRLEGCTVAGNLGTHGGGVNSINPLELERCILWENCAILDGEQVYSGISTFRCCAVDTTGVNSWVRATYDEDCIFADPLFCDPLCGWTTAGAWTLNAASGCLPQHSPCGELIGALGWGCGARVGACCLPDDGTCEVLTRESCQELQGVYLDDDTVCDPNPCPSTPVELPSWGTLKALFRGVGT